MMNGKLVRDKIPEIMRVQGRDPVLRQLDEDSYRDALVCKLYEEVSEYAESGSIEELADVLEVVYALTAIHGRSADDLERLRVKKERERGGFVKRILLVDGGQAQSVGSK